MNPIHALVLPSGRILMVAGSSNRNVQGATGVEVTRADQLNLVDNAAIFDPKALSWEKIPSLPQSVRTGFEAARAFGTDLFCSGHALLPDGRALFAGGTASYKSNFQGARLLWTFDEQKKEWSAQPPMSDGRWYPTLLQMPNGKVAILSGLNGGASRKISHMLDVFDPATNRVTNSDMRRSPGYPFSDTNMLEHYPRILPLNAGKWLITGDGTGMGPINRTSTALMSISAEGRATFDAGPKRPLGKRLYGTAVTDPSTPSGDVLLIGGMPGFGDPGAVTPKTHPKTPTLRALERFNAESRTWSSEPNFLGTTANDARVGHYATLLPTGELLVINGSNYIQNRGTYNPLLFTPTGPRAFRSKAMKRATFPRFYHNVALLLPDGRVWVNGSNRDRAIVKNDGTVDQGNVMPGPASDPDVKNTDMKYIPAGARIEKEFTRVEIFSPPYLFKKDGSRIPESERPQVATPLPKVDYGNKIEIGVTGAKPGGKVNLVRFGSATHAWDNGQTFVSLTVAHKGGDKVEVHFPTNPYQMPPGYYHLFYVSAEGVPSIGAPVVVAPQR